MMRIEHLKKQYQCHLAFIQMVIFAIFLHHYWDKIKKK